MDWESLLSLIGTPGGSAAVPGADAMASAPLGAALSPTVGTGISAIGAEAPGGIRPEVPGSGSTMNLANVLRGVQIPKPLAPQTVHTPAAPRPVAAIHSGELINLLQMLNTAGRANQSGLNLPPTLGAALGQHQYPV